MSTCFACEEVDKSMECIPVHSPQIGKHFCQEKGLTTRAILSLISYLDLKLLHCLTPISQWGRGSTAGRLQLVPNSFCIEESSIASMENRETMKGERRTSIKHKYSCLLQDYPAFYTGKVINV